MTSRREETLKVFVRVRPPIYKEVKHETAVMVRGDSSVSVYYENKETQNSYDHVFAEVSSQADVFEKVKPLLVDVLSGINSCIFAYGQTSSGKSHTMIGPNGGQDTIHTSPEMWGILPRASEFLLGYLNEKARDGILTYSVKASFLQIYNENLFDLLRDSGPMFEEKMLQTVRDGSSSSNGGKENDLRIREVPKPKSMAAIGAPSEVYVSGLSEFRVENSADILKIVAIGTNNRMTRSTDYNFTSSRSHAILQLTFEIETQVESGQTLISRSKLNLIDLAGSEKMSVTEENTLNTLGSIVGAATANKHVKELTSINKSLHALGNVIAALSSNNRSHVPYRDSKLTRLLQDSLGGNTKTILIACVAPTVLHTVETLSTLAFADRAKHVRLQQVKANTVIDDKLTLAKAQAEISRLKALLSHALKQLEEEKKERVPSMRGLSLAEGNDLTPAEVEQVLQENEDLRRENNALRRGGGGGGGNGGGRNSLDYLAPSPRYETNRRVKQPKSNNSNNNNNNNNNIGDEVKKAPAARGFMSGVDRFSYDKDKDKDKDKVTPLKKRERRKRGSADGGVPDDSDLSDMDSVRSGAAGGGRRAGGARGSASERQAPPSSQSSVESARDSNNSNSNNRRNSKSRHNAHSAHGQQGQGQHEGVFFAIQQRQRMELNQLLAEANAKLQQQVLGYTPSQQQQQMMMSMMTMSRDTPQPEDGSPPLLGAQNSAFLPPISSAQPYTNNGGNNSNNNNGNGNNNNGGIPPSSSRSSQNGYSNNPAFSARGNNNNNPNALDTNRSTQPPTPLYPSSQQQSVSFAPASTVISPAKQTAAEVMLAVAGDAGAPTNRVFRSKKPATSTNPNVNASAGSSSMPQLPSASQNQEGMGVSMQAQNAMQLQQQVLQQQQNTRPSMQSVVRSTAAMMALQQQQQQQHQQQQNYGNNNQQYSPTNNNMNNMNNSNTSAAANLSGTPDDIGRTLEMFSFRQNGWERIDLLDFDGQKRMYKVRYPNSAVQWLDLSKKPVRSLPDEVH